ncbi:MAG: hypothetical protein ACLTLQ_08495 [[Clostridium] scindens]
MVDKLNTIKIDDSTTGTLIKAAIEEGTDMLQKWLRTDLLGRANEIMSNLTVGVINILKRNIQCTGSWNHHFSVHIVLARRLLIRRGRRNRSVYAIPVSCGTPIWCCI